MKNNVKDDVVIVLSGAPLLWRSGGSARAAPFIRRGECACKKPGAISAGASCAIPQPARSLYESRFVVKLKIKQ